MNGSVLRAAVAVGNAESALADLAAGCPVDDKDELGYTALHYACRSDRLNMESLCMILLDHGASANAKTNNNVTPLHLCCLVQKPPSLVPGQEKKEEEERNRKQNAVIQSKIRIIEDLLSRNADPMARDNTGLCPLHLAANGGVREIVRLLLLHTAKTRMNKNGDKVFHIPYVKMCDRFGKNPAAWALSGNQQESYILLFLAEFGYEFDALYDQLVNSGSVDVAAVKNKFSLTAQELRLLEQFVAQYCTVSATGEPALPVNRIKENDAIRGQVDFAEAVDEMQELMRKRAGRIDEAALMIDINKMDDIRKTFLQLKSLLVNE